MLFLVTEVQENKKALHRAIGTTCIACAVIFVLPFICESAIQYIKEKGIEDYLNGKVEVIQTEEQNFYLWQSTNV